MPNGRVGLEHGFVFSLVPDFREMFEVMADVAFVPRDQDWFDVDSWFSKVRNFPRKSIGIKRQIELFLAPAGQSYLKNLTTIHRRHEVLGQYLRALF
jgi:hypothetical protein